MTTSPNPSNQEILQAVRFHPFFQGVEESTALSLLEGCQYKHYEKTNIVLDADTTRTGLIFIIKGTAEVYIQMEAGLQEEILEVIQKGEFIGLSSLADFLGVPRPQGATVEVRAVEDLQVLLIPFEIVLQRWNDPAVRDYFLTVMAVRLRDVYTSLAEQIKLSKAFFEKGAIITRVQDIMRSPAVVVSADQTLVDAAQIMSIEKVSSVVVVEKGAENAGSKVVGILTERDIVSRVVAKGLAYKETSLRAIMTKDPLAIERVSYYYDALSCMLVNAIKHLPVVQDGELVGMVTLSDLLRKKSECYIKTIRCIDEAEDNRLPQMKEAMYEIVETLIRDQVPVFTLLDTVTALYDRLVVRVVELAVKNLEKKGWNAQSRFAFYQMGSGGRREQILLTDQDHFLVYEEAEGAEEFFKKLGNEITRLLECAGYSRCVGFMMASEKQWRGSVRDWEERLRGWMARSSNENLLLAQNFFSYRFMTGSHELHQTFETTIRNTLNRSKIFLFRLTQVEREHEIPIFDSPFRTILKVGRKQIHIKKEILFPLHHGVQILSLFYGMVGGTPKARIEKLADAGVISKEFSSEMLSALELVLKLFIQVRWESNGSHSSISIDRLSSREKSLLNTSLKTLREFQSLVFSHFSI